MRRQLSQQLASKGLVGGKKHRLEVHEKRSLEAAEMAKETCAHRQFAKQYKNLTTKEWHDILFSDECPKYLCQLPNRKNDVVWGGGKKLKMDHLGRNDRPQSHWASFIPQGQTLTADYYINNILEKEVKPLLRSKNVNEAIHKRKLFSSNRHMSSSKTGAAHAVKATQAWCKSNLPNFIEKTSCCGLQIRQISTLWRIFGA